MKACVYKQYGPPEVVSVIDIPVPEIKNDEVLVQVMASTVNRTDSGFRSAEYFVSRFWSGLVRPKFSVLGCEFAGVVVKAGSSVTQYKVGDKVFGFNDKSFGGHAQYLAISETAAMSFIPEGMSFETAAALTEGAHYAWVDIKAAQVKAGDEVLVYGATGAIGSAAIQILLAMNVTVTAVCNTKNRALIKSLGVQHVIDYQTEDFTQTTTRFHFILDAVGKSSFGACKPLLRENGIYISTELGKNAENIWFALSTSRRKGKKVLFPIPLARKEDIEYIRSLAQAGKFTPVIDRSYPMTEIVEAYGYVESGQKTGNVILNITHP